MWSARERVASCLAEPPVETSNMSTPASTSFGTIGDDDQGRIRQVMLLHADPQEERHTGREPGLDALKRLGSASWSDRWFEMGDRNWCMR